MKAKIFMSILMLGLVACSGTSDDKDSSKRKAPGTSTSAPTEQESPAVEAFERSHLSGQIDGQTWTQISGRVITTDDGKSYLALWDVDVVNPCSPSEAIQRAVVTQIDLEPKRIELNKERPVRISLFDGQMTRSLDVEKGVLKIQSVEGGKLYGALMANHSELNHIEGTFEVIVCQ